jgi:hypothetical protein
VLDVEGALFTRKPNWLGVGFHRRSLLDVGLLVDFGLSSAGLTEILGDGLSDGTHRARKSSGTERLRTLSGCVQGVLVVRLGSCNALLLLVLLFLDRRLGLLRLPLGDLVLLGTAVESSSSVVVFCTSVVSYASVWLLGRSLSGSGAVAVLVQGDVAFSLARILGRVELLLKLSDRVLNLVVVGLSLLHFANGLFGGLVAVLSARDASVTAAIAALSGCVDVGVCGLAGRSCTSLGSSRAPRLFELLGLSIPSGLGGRPASRGTALGRHIDELLKGCV